MIRKNLVALFAFVALACLAMPSFAETPQPELLKACSAPELSDASAPPAPQFLSGQMCSAICSFEDCLGAMEGTPCTKRFGGAGLCTITGRVCSPGNKQCGCW